MSKNLFCQSGQAITRKHQLQTTAADMVPEQGGANACQKGCENFRLHLWALQYSRGTRDLYARAKRADNINLDGSHRAHQRFGLSIEVFELALQAVDPVAQSVESPFAEESLRSSTIKLSV